MNRKLAGILVQCGVTGLIILWGVMLMLKQDASLSQYHPVPGHTPVVVIYQQ